jgi:hypothetical protein
MVLESHLLPWQGGGACVGSGIGLVGGVCFGFLALLAAVLSRMGGVLLISAAAVGWFLAGVICSAVR